MSEYKLEEVFKLSGVPDVTFVEPVEFERLLVALRTQGRGVVIEGSSGIGKTSAVAKAIDRLSDDLGTSTLSLSARRQDDRELIAELPNIRDAGVVIIDDFHRLEAALRLEIADYLKLLADEEREDTNIIVIGINRAGESLLSFALT
jgi:serine kinase of HPr protein (carbohydrate metabolism regulator)